MGCYEVRKAVAAGVAVGRELGADGLVVVLIPDSGSGRSLIAWFNRGGGVSSDNARQAFPDEFERRLMQNVPRNFAETCERGGLTFANLQATVKCRPKGAARFAWYLSFTSSSAFLEHTKRRTKEWRGVKGSCTSRGPLSPAVAPYASSSGNPSGERICFKERDVYWVEWSDVPHGIYGYASSGRSLDKLYRWWLSGGAFAQDAGG